MSTTPIATPETTPVEGPTAGLAVVTVAIAVLLLLHVPPPGVDVRLVELPSQTVAVPVIAVGVVFTLTTRDMEQPSAVVAVIVVTPTEMPANTPLVASIDPIAGVDETQPVASVLVYVAVAPTHTLAGALIAPGAGLTVKTIGVEQPVAVKRYEIVAVPDAIAVTTPLVMPTVATDVLLLYHAPEVDVVDKVEVAPGHADNVPEIAAGKG